jgi:lipopolysaccharide export system permease protein
MLLRTYGIVKLLDRYIAIQFVEILALGTLLIAGIFFGTYEFKRILSLMFECGIPWQSGLMTTALQLPYTCVYCLPAGVLISTMYVLLRQGMDSEIVVLRTTGVSLGRILRPFFALGLICTSISFALNEFVVPTARRTANTLLVVAAYNSELPAACNWSGGAQFGDREQQKILLVGSFAQRHLCNVVLLDFTQKDIIQLIWSRLGSWQRGNWNLFDGHIYRLSSNDDDVRSSRFSRMVIPGMSQFAVDLSQQRYLPSELTTVELARRIDSIKAAGKHVDPELIRRLHKRFAQPLACLLLVVAAAPLCLLGRRSRGTFGYIYGGTIIAAFFLLQNISAALGENGRLDPVVSSWMPSVALALFGAGLLYVRFKREL